MSADQSWRVRETNGDKTSSIIQVIFTHYQLVLCNIVFVIVVEYNCYKMQSSGIKIGGIVNQITLNKTTHISFIDIKPIVIAL